MADTSAILQSLTASLASVISGADQQLQASPAVASLLWLRQPEARVLNSSVALVQASTKVRLVSCRAPSEVAEPEQVRADLLPPPRSTSLRAMGPNTDCLPDFLPAMEACFSILFFCFSKLVTTSFHLFMAVTAFSMHMPSSVLVDFLVPLLFFLLLFLLLLFFLLPFLLFDLFLFLFFSPFFWVLFLFLKVFLFLLAASASADLATREDPSSSERLLSSLFSAEARTARATRRPKRMRQILLFIFVVRD